MNPIPDPPPPAGLLRRRLLRPLGNLVRQGHTPERIALSVALGVAFGLFPVFGTTTVLCVLAAIALRLNHPAIQVANQLMYPLQIPLVFVFVRFGEFLLGTKPVPLAPPTLAAEMRANPSVLLARFGMAGLHGIVGWVVVAPLVAAAVYATALPLLRLALRRRAASEPVSVTAA